MIKFEMLVHAFSSGGESAPAELSPQFPQVGNFVKLNSFLPFSFSSVCGWPKSANFIKRELVRISCLTEAAVAQTGWNKTITRLVCPALKHASPAYWFFKPLLSGGGGGWQADDGVSKATRKPFSNLSRQDKSASFINYSWFVIMGLSSYCVLYSQAKTPALVWTHRNQNSPLPCQTSRHHFDITVSNMLSDISTEWWWGCWWL